MQTTKPPITTTSVAENLRQRWGIQRCILRPSSRSSRHSATSAITVERIATTIAASFKAVGVVEEPGVDDRRNAQARRGRSGQVVNMPTSAGRRFGSGSRSVVLCPSSDR